MTCYPSFAIFTQDGPQNWHRGEIDQRYLNTPHVVTHTYCDPTTQCWAHYQPQPNSRPLLDTPVRKASPPPVIPLVPNEYWGYTSTSRVIPRPPTSPRLKETSPKVWVQPAVQYAVPAVVHVPAWYVPPQPSHWLMHRF